MQDRVNTKLALADETEELASFTHDQLVRKKKRQKSVVPLAKLSDDDLVDEPTFCRIIGGDHTPIHRSSLWRGISAGRYPKPMKIGPGTNRWRVGEGRAVLRRAAAERDGAAA